ncbi:uncharacterized protein FOMMEDRAFT_162584 [Fomitiporia mediterranea MF3/22]|uniref:Uncharacterized protein n=1 Tax=Fomitiporia mediterranea (strain MF3/22) TaxID=694068 RepID=R7SJL1_FOMME|nr:uncharacterized protein FOMMEDRAFT_162584 [Fomitiporia mediterranea MF3/22]EJC97764.1 hypothetical protein FOMMEDRAFT_162584 [Fomitiporia mediterranea MF3/22]
MSQNSKGLPGFSEISYENLESVKRCGIQGFYVVANTSENFVGKHIDALTSKYKRKPVFWDIYLGFRKGGSLSYVIIHAGINLDSYKEAGEDMEGLPLEVSVRYSRNAAAKLTYAAKKLYFPVWYARPNMKSLLDYWFKEKGRNRLRTGKDGIGLFWIKTLLDDAREKGYIKDRDEWEAWEALASQSGEIIEVDSEFYCIPGSGTFESH